MKLYITMMLAVIVAAITLLLTGHSNASFITGWGGTVIVLGLTLLYIVLFDSRSRWPNTTAWRRFVNVMTFQR